MDMEPIRRWIRVYLSKTLSLFVLNSFLVALLQMNIDLDFGKPQVQKEAVEALKVRFIVKASSSCCSLPPPAPHWQPVVIARPSSLESDSGRSDLKQNGCRVWMSLKRLDKMAWAACYIQK